VYDGEVLDPSLTVAETEIKEEWDSTGTPVVLDMHVK
jgi:hypothetical protein